MVSLINKQLLLTAYAYLFITEQQKAQQGGEALQLQGETLAKQMAAKLAKLELTKDPKDVESLKRQIEKLKEKIVQTEVQGAFQGHETVWQRETELIFLQLHWGRRPCDVVFFAKTVVSALLAEFEAIKGKLSSDIKTKKVEEWLEIVEKLSKSDGSIPPVLDFGNPVLDPVLDPVRNPIEEMEKIIELSMRTTLSFCDDEAKSGEICVQRAGAHCDEGWDVLSKIPNAQIPKVLSKIRAVTRVGTGGVKDNYGSMEWNLSFGHEVEINVDWGVVYLEGVRSVSEDFTKDPSVELKKFAATTKRTEREDRFMLCRKVELHEVRGGPLQVALSALEGSIKKDGIYDPKDDTKLLCDIQSTTFKDAFKALKDNIELNDIYYPTKVNKLLCNMGGLSGAQRDALLTNIFGEEAGVVWTQKQAKKNRNDVIGGKP